MILSIVLFLFQLFSVDRAFAQNPDWKALLTPYVRTLNRPVTVFHYGKRSDIQDGGCPEEGCAEVLHLERGGDFSSAVELRPPEAAEYFSKMSGLFAQGVNRGWTVGGGLYAAVDPVQSFDYAVAPWFLLSITVPAGTTYLDLRVRDDLGKRIQDQWSIPKDEFEFARFILALKQLGIQFLVYAWQPPAFLVCQPLQGSVAFDFIDSGLTSKVDLKVFVPYLDGPGSSLEQIEKLSAYRELYGQYRALDWKIVDQRVVSAPNEKTMGVFEWGFRWRQSFLDQWATELGIGELEKAEVLRGVQENYFGCSERWGQEQVW